MFGRPRVSCGGTNSAASLTSDFSGGAREDGGGRGLFIKIIKKNRIQESGHFQISRYAATPPDTKTPATSKTHQYLLAQLCVAIS